MPSPKIFRVDDLTVQVYNSEIEMSRQVAEIVQHYLQDVIRRQNTARLLFATGNSQIKFLQDLIALGNVDWEKITCFHLDEYLGITANHPASFRYYLQNRVENHIHPQKFHYIQGDTLQPLAECSRYSQLLQAQPIDLCLLGMGNNGHIAFNDPDVAEFQDPYMMKLVKLDLANRQQQVDTGYFPNLLNVPEYGLTVTIPMICSARKIICLAPTQRKAKVVKQMLHGNITTDCPASILRQQIQATLFLDVDAAKLLHQ
ncbi:glucosamine-6-phosphate deaminase [Calothrix rhizosoleniae]|uniref:glucosamine-6-phosphate deaminase n=1 Tax=Calothrix rhizosoleniae TaxID=888997 RepID=UPI000B498850|nr:glucosamine-6-phosphate deaminase [Calothrix rhizosoleniae]